MRMTGLLSGLTTDPIDEVTRDSSFGEPTVPLDT
jgi:hypothetical protein